MSGPSRRKCLTMLISTAFAPKTIAAAGYRETSAAAAFMQHSSVLPRVRYHRFSDGWYVLTEPITWPLTANCEGEKTVIVPAGFVTDLVIAPREKRDLWLSDESYLQAVFIFDWICLQRQVSSEIASSTATAIMKGLKVETSKRRTLCAAMRRKSLSCCNQYRTDHCQPEILKRWPANPSLTLKVWRSLPGVLL